MLNRQYENGAIDYIKKNAVIPDPKTVMSQATIAQWLGEPQWFHRPSIEFNFAHDSFLDKRRKLPQVLFGTCLYAYNHAAFKGQDAFLLP